MKNTIVVVGAGISGLLLARELRARGARVQVLEKSRGVGGRMSSKRVGDAVFDQGAQYFTTRNEEFRAMVERWSAGGAVTGWPGGERQRWIARPCMTGLPKALARDLSVKLNHQVTAVTRHASGCWEVAVDGEGLVRAERLVMTSPVPQSLALLDAGGVALPGALRAALAACTYHPCLALMLVLDGKSAVPAAGVRPTAGPIRWLADNVAKGLAQGAQGAVTVHLTREFSERHYSGGEREVFERVLPALRPHLGTSRVVNVALHRWRYSEPETFFPQSHLWLPELQLGFCGDAFASGRVEGAALSGLALAREIALALQPE